MSLYIRVCCVIDEVVDFVEYFGEYCYDIEYEFDGIVVKVDEFELYDEFGVMSWVLCWVIVYKYLLEEV